VCSKLPAVGGLGKPPDGRSPANIHNIGPGVSVYIDIPK